MVVTAQQFSEGTDKNLKKKNLGQGNRYHGITTEQGLAFRLHKLLRVFRLYLKPNFDSHLLFYRGDSTILGKDCNVYCCVGLYCTAE